MCIVMMNNKDLPKGRDCEAKSVIMLIMLIWLKTVGLLGTDCSVHTVHHFILI